MKETAWIIGASTGLGRQLAEKLAQQGVDVVLSSRNERDLDAICSHIKNKYRSAAVPFLLDLENITDVPQSRICIDRLLQAGQYPASCYFIAGSIHEKDDQLQAAEVLNSLMQQNFTGPVLLMNEILQRKQDRPVRIVVASSVATARARGKNIAYGTAKRALEQYGAGLMHALGNTNACIQVYRLGYLDTNKSYGQKLPFPPADPQKIASQIIADARKGPGLYYRPKFWWFITIVLNMIPFQIYKKLKF